MIAASVKIDHAELDRLAAQFGEASGAYVKVGILGDSSRGTNPHKNRRWLSKPIWARGAAPEKTGWSHGFEARNAAGQTVQILPGHLSNAEIGVVHEFGSPHGRIPERSFLRMPIMSRLDDELKSQTESAWRELFQAEGPLGVLRGIGQAAVNVIQEAFATGGFGRWAKLARATIRRKGSDTILKDTGQLARSITFSVIGAGKGGAK